MKVLLTGASGFVGSHILERLVQCRIPTAILLRPASPRVFLEPFLSEVEVRHGSIIEPRSLPPALTGVTHVIHCAGCVKAVRNCGFYQVNQIGTRNIVDAVNRAANPIRRLILVSSLAASGPATRDKPASEGHPPRPVSEYGKSKLAGEHEVREHCQTEYVIVRPPAVYGPRDAAFLPLFKAVKNHVLPSPSPRQDLSLVFVQDLAEAIVACLEHPVAAGKTYFVAGPEVVTARRMAKEIATQLHSWALPCPLPAAALWPICLANEIRARLTGRASVLSIQKFPELRAPGWVCDPSLMHRELGNLCTTPLKQGIEQTLASYRAAHWL